MSEKKVGKKMEKGERERPFSEKLGTYLKGLGRYWLPEAPWIEATDEKLRVGISTDNLNSYSLGRFLDELEKQELLFDVFANTGEIVLEIELEGEQ